ncbi:MAG TPA: hypothetical protein VN089_27515 [Duganella sp.]|nr:hypothetical protein [Duganella sp.]
MNPRQVFAIGVLLLFSLSQAADKTKPETAEPRPLIGNYQVYGGSLSDMLPPTPADRNLAFEFQGQTAKDLFEYIGPDVKKGKACTDNPDYRERRRGDLHCVYWKTSGYRCFLGLDLRLGKSTNGSIC